MVDIRAAEPADTQAMVRIHTDALHHYGADSYNEVMLRYLAPMDAEPADSELSAMEMQRKLSEE